MRLRPDGKPDRIGPRPTGSGRTRALVVHPERSDEPGSLSARTAETRLEEARGLAHAIDLDVVEAIIVPLRQPRPATLFGQGKVAEIGELASTLEIDLVIVNGAVSPIQQRNLEKAWNTKVLDRTGLILEIFGERAATKEGRLQVELANLTYQRSRLVRSWTHLERQRGGTGFLAGPGETQIEADRRQIAERISRVKSELALVTRTRKLHRKARRRVPYPILALVGYTNAGKSTLFNRLTSASVTAKDLLFATLDPTMRALALPGGAPVILSDTVGFISDLPTDLVAAFRATLEEVEEADIILHVRDIAHPESDEQRMDVLNVLKQLGIDAESGAGIIEVWNKADRLDDETRARLSTRAQRTPGVCLVSSLTGEGIDTLLDLLARTLAARREAIDIVVQPEEGQLLAWLHERGVIVQRETLESGATRLKVLLDPENLGRLDGLLAQLHASGKEAR